MDAMQEYKRLQDQFSTTTSPAGMAVRDILNLHQPTDYDGVAPILYCETCVFQEESIEWPCDTVKLILVRFP